MKVILTSFGIHDDPWSKPEPASFFSGTPPMSFDGTYSQFMPEFEMLLLADKVVMDALSYDRLVTKSPDYFKLVSETLQALNSDGRIEFSDFSTLLFENKELLDSMLETDLQSIDPWIEPLGDSLEAWRNYSCELREITKLIGFSTHGHMRTGVGHFVLSNTNEIAPGFSEGQSEDAKKLSMVEEIIRSMSKRKRKGHREAFREVLTEYLRSVNANLVISKELGIGFHDWADFSPFYKKKFLGKNEQYDTLEKSKEQVENLFTLSFPQLKIDNSVELLRVLNDKRLNSLRDLVSRAAKAEITFDQEYALSILFDVCESARQLARNKTLVGYLTLPLGLIPGIGTPLQRITEDLVDASLQRKAEEPNRWFYMLTDVKRRAKAPLSIW